MNRSAVVLLLASACGAIDLPCGTPPEEDVDVTVSTVTLGDQCSTTTSGVQAFDCAPQFVGGGCASICRASSVQLDLASFAHHDVAFTVVEVRLIDPNTGRVVARLAASGPTTWSGSQYSAWNEVLSSRNNVKAKYTLTAPDWITIEGNGAQRLSGSQKFKTEVDVRIDGRLRTVLGPEAFREPPVAT